MICTARNLQHFVSTFVLCEDIERHAVHCKILTSNTGKCYVLKETDCFAVELNDEANFI